MNKEDCAEKRIASFFLALPKLHQTVMAAVLIDNLNNVGLRCQLIKMPIQLEPNVWQFLC